MVEPGTLVAGKLRIERLLGQGGMGTVYVATHLGLDQQVAIKVLDPALTQQPEVVARFVREARASARLKSDHVCRVMDVGTLDDGVPYIEMELLAGEDLGQLIDRGGALPTNVAADYVLQACVAVAEAHALGIVHRDLKPANLFVTRRLDGTALVKVLDFGIATAPSSAELKITKTTAVMGSPGYMSPEHLRSARDVDARSDIWALGVILYEAASGNLPFVAQTITELAVKVVMDEPEPLIHVDPLYAAIVAKCLAKDPAYRYQSVGDLAADLAPIGGPSAQASAMLVMRVSGGPSASMQVARGPSGVVPAPTGSKVSGFGATMPHPTAHTTLGGAAGASQPLHADATPKSKSKRAAFLLAAVAVFGGGAAAAIALTQHETTSKVAHEARRDAAAIVAQTTPDAAPTIPSPVIDAAAEPVVDENSILVGLTELEGEKNWAGIITMAKSVHGNPDVDKLYATAKTNYLAQRLAVVKGYVNHHDCTSATSAAEDSVKVLEDAKAEFAAAAASCKVAAPKPATTTPTPEDLANSASAALAKHDYVAALELAQKALVAEPKNVTALDVAARAACSSGQHDPKIADQARAFIARLAADDRAVASQLCRDNGIQPTKPKPMPTTPGQPDAPLTLAEVPAELAAAKTANHAGDFAAAEKAAKRVVAVEPRNVGALHMLGLAACALHHQSIADKTIATLEGMTGTGQRVRNSILLKIRDACNRQ